MQLDLFEHSHDVALRNAAILAARAADLSSLAPALAALAAALPHDTLIPDLATVLAALSAPVAPRLARDAGARALQTAEALAAAAARLFGAASRSWMAPHWVDLAGALTDLAFDPADEALHTAPLLLRAGHWREALDATAGIPSAHRQPAPLAWRAEAEYRQGGLASALPALTELAWLDPARCAGLITRLQDDALARLLREFDHDFEGEGGPEDVRWFPAYLLIAAPHWAKLVRLAQAGAGSAAERAARQLLELQVLERQGRQSEIGAARRALRALHAGVFDLYMRSR